jgi:hypothetical protein
MAVDRLREVLLAVMDRTSLSKNQVVVATVTNNATVVLVETRATTVEENRLRESLPIRNERRILGLGGYSLILEEGETKDRWQADSETLREIV